MVWLRQGSNNLAQFSPYARVEIISQFNFIMITTEERTRPSVGDYLHCLDCDETFDYWKYDSLADTGHNGHTLRALTGDEFREAAADCAEDNCEDE